MLISCFRIVTPNASNNVKFKTNHNKLIVGTLYGKYPPLRIDHIAYKSNTKNAVMVIPYVRALLYSFILYNYRIANQERVAGAGFNIKFLKQIKRI